MNKRLKQIEQGLASLIAIHEQAEQRHEQRQAENDKQIRELRESQAETQKEIRETQQEIRELKAYVEGVASELRGLGISQGKIGEEVLFQALKKCKRLGDIHFDTIRRNVLDSNSSSEIDILLINKVCVGLIEVKVNLKAQIRHKGRRADRTLAMKALVDKKVKQFREGFHEYKNHKLYFGFGTLITDDELIEQARANGIFLLTQDGDHIEVVNDNVRPF